MSEKQKLKYWKKCVPSSIKKFHTHLQTSHPLENRQNAGNSSKQVGSAEITCGYWIRPYKNLHKHWLVSRLLDWSTTLIRRVDPSDGGVTVSSGAQMEREFS